jgi:uncharacterized protein RhaS with RHS repeats
MSYDESGYPLLTYGSVTHWSTPSTSACGNMTSTGRWLDTTNSYIWTHAQSLPMSNPVTGYLYTDSVTGISQWSNGYTYDALGRVKSVMMPDNAKVSYTYSGNTVTVLDQQGNARQNVTDAIGRLTQVMSMMGKRDSISCKHAT